MLAKSCLQNVSGNWCLSLLDDRELHTVLKPKTQSRDHYFSYGKGSEKIEECSLQPSVNFRVSYT